MDSVDYSRVRKQIDRLPQHIKKRFIEWMSSIENIGWIETKSLRLYRDHALKGMWVGKRAACLGRDYRIIYKISKNSKISLIQIEVDRVTKHDYKRK